MRGTAIAITVVLVLVLAGAAAAIGVIRARTGAWPWDGLFGGGGPGGTAGPGADGHDHVHGDPPELDDEHFTLRALFQGDGDVMRVVYLNREGARLAGARDDASLNRSSIVLGAKKDHVEVPAYRGTFAQWTSFVKCMEKHFAPFDVEITDRRPVEGRYVMAVVGGTPDLVGRKPTISGLAPWSGGIVEDPVVLVFARKLRERPEAICDTAAMEVAHTYGLDHEILCSDPMSYIAGCGRRAFRDQDAPCGEKEPRTCDNGAPTQNSYRMLMAILGPRK